MWLPNKRYCARRRAARGALSFSFAGAAIVLCLSAFAARAQDEQLSKAGEADHQIVLREHAGWNRDCDPIDHPALDLHQAPQHGYVCARIENIKIHSMSVGTEAQCIGHVVRGIQLIYRPDRGYVGSDDLSYVVQYSSVLRTISINVSVSADAPAAQRAVPSAVATPVLQRRQTVGPVPACDDLMF